MQLRSRREKRKDAKAAEKRRVCNAQFRYSNSIRNSLRLSAFSASLRLFRSNFCIARIVSTSPPVVLGDVDAPISGGVRLLAWSFPPTVFNL